MMRPLWGNLGPLVVPRRMAAGGSFVPTDVAGCVLWLHADSLALGDGDAVETWPDASAAGNDVSQSDAGSKPTFKTNVINGKPVVRFDGVNDYLFSAGNITWGHVFAVAHFTAADSSVNPGAMMDNRDPTNSFGYAFLWYLDGNFYSRGSAGGISSASQPTGWNVLSSKYPSTGNIRVNASTVATGTLGAVTGVIDIGIINAVPSVLFTGDIAEIVIYSIALSDADRNQVESYLAAKYGL